MMGIFILRRLYLHFFYNLSKFHFIIIIMYVHMYILYDCVMYKC